MFDENSLGAAATHAKPSQFRLFRVFRCYRKGRVIRGEDFDRFLIRFSQISSRSESLKNLAQPQNLRSVLPTIRLFRVFRC